MKQESQRMDKRTAAQRARDRDNSMKNRKDSKLDPETTKKDSLDTSIPRDGKAIQFTVGNVGNNGRLFLRPIQRPQQQAQAPQVQAPQAPALPGSIKSRPFAQIARNGQEARDSVWTLLSHPMRFDEKPDIVTRESLELRPRHQRSQSQSTVDTQLAQERLETGAFRIVIDRPDSAPKPEAGENGELPSLEIPIPHYRLGTPRFSARGTAFFHQSTYTKSSMTGEESSLFSRNEIGEIFPKPPGIEAHQIISRRHSYASAQPWASETGMATPQAKMYKTRAPITPEVFDQIALAPNDPSIVKYSAINRDIIAATPARIITQITSEKFLDYELLSDFFLTVRSYLSTYDLLAYLLCRFEWALNRSDDSGRVVRVRTFAALRHWILNYFSYDFVTDRDLRVHFCERLNEMARSISLKPGDASTDMKLISDLKKCWNGRCLVYWDNSAASMDDTQQSEIEPGGILGSRDSRLVHSSQLRPPPAVPSGLSVNPAQIAAGAQSISNWYSAVMEHSERQVRGHTRHQSAGTVGSYPVTGSEQSAAVVSCSIPGRHGAKAGVQSSRVQPVTTDGSGRRICPPAPSALSHETAQRDDRRRSGSFSDAARDLRAPLSAEVASNYEAVAQEIYHGNSMLRGFAFPPTSADVNPAPTTPVFELPQLQLPSSSGSTSDISNRNRPNAHHTPHGKGFIGNIRRALSSKHGNTGQNSGSGACPIAIGKSATLPQNVQSQLPNLNGFSGKARLDHLAANVCDAFQLATTAPVSYQEEVYSVGPAYAEPTPNFEPAEQMSDGSRRLLFPEAKAPELSRFTSGVTDSSRSILIGDDTAFNFADPPEPEPPVPDIPYSHGNLKAKPTPLKSAKTEQSQLALPRINKSASHEGRLTGNFDDEERDQWKSSMAQTRPMHTRNASHATNRSGSLSLRRHASFHSTYAKHNKGLSVDTSGGSRQGSMITKEAPARALKRKPGGNLRANENVHDMEYPTRPRSAGSIITYSESLRESHLLGFGEKITRTFARGTRDLNQSLLPTNIDTKAPKKDVSYVRTHSSQHAIRRPSFEAAVAEFARIPDDDEGGIEATLLKLEGKYRSPIQSPVNQEFSGSQIRLPTATTTSEDVRVSESAIASDVSSKTVQRDESGALPQVPMGHKHWQPTPLSPVQLKRREPRETVVSTLYTNSEDSYNSTPLLERSDADKSSPVAKGKSRELDLDIPKSRTLRQGSVAPTATTDSFLLDEGDEFLSDVSSELSMDTISAEEKSEEWVQSIRAPEDEEMVTVNQQHPPSPPMTEQIAYSMGLQANKSPLQVKPPTPNPSPPSRHVIPNITALTNPDMPPAWTKTPHMPFILGFDSQILAQQFTILEKEALREIDWRDLVDLRWQNSLASPLNWVTYLLSQDPLGIDLVTARFNIMVKWAISEIVLTETIEERALTIMKFIHVAHQARKIHNFATLFQLTIALTSADCTRLSKTWDLVPEVEKDILQDLEILVSPRRNFHNLRAEMEKVDSDEGCIPVLALYIHDLTYNAGKPSQLPAVNDGEPLVNFERYRTAATIVKALLQLIDAASKYNYQPMQGVIERCLWLACLSDDEIMQKSKRLATKV